MMTQLGVNETPEQAEQGLEIMVRSIEANESINHRLPLSESGLSVGLN